MSRNKLAFICQLVPNEIRKQDMQFRQAVPVDEQVGTLLCPLGSGERYRSVGPNFALGKSLPHSLPKSLAVTFFINALVSHPDQFIHFAKTERETCVTTDYTCIHIMQHSLTREVGIFHAFRCTV